MARKPQDISIYRIAEEAGVAVSTVSKVINKRNGISEVTREKINRLLLKYKFTPNYPVQRAIRIAVVVQDYYFSAYVRKAMEGIFKYTQKQHLVTHIIIQSSPEDSLLELIREQQCAGVILIGGGSQYRLHELSKTELLTVVLDSKTTEEGVGFIDNDSYSGSCAATKHLLDLGHKKIGYLTFAKQHFNDLERLKGFENTMAGAGCPVPQARIIKYAGDTNIPTNVQGARAMKQLLQQAPEITAVMTAGDSLASGAMTAIHQAGLKIPDDISVIGFDNYPETSGWYPALTTVDHPVEKGGYMAAEAIHTGLKNPGDWNRPQDILPTTLIVRESTGAVRDNG